MTTDLIFLADATQLDQASATASARRARRRRSEAAWLVWTRAAGAGAALGDAHALVTINV